MQPSLLTLILAALLCATPAGAQAPPANPGTTEAERWAWTELRAGRFADFHERCRSRPDPRQPDNPRWRDDCRRIGAAFIERAATLGGWQEAPAHRGIRIAGAMVGGRIDLSGARILPDLSLEASLFEAPVVLDRSRLEGMLSFNGSAFRGGFSANAVRVGGDLFMQHVMVEGGPLFLRVARIEGIASFSGARLGADMMAGGMRVGRSVYFDDGAELRGALDLLGAKIADDLGLAFARMDRLIGDRMELGGSLFLRDTIVPTVDVTLARIGGSLEFSNAQLTAVDLSGTTIGGDLRLASAEHPVARWQPGARLNLRNLQAAAVQDWVGANGPDAWPPMLNLQGFTYTRLGGYAGDGQEPLRRDSAWFSRWLARDPTFTRQPYQQLAAVFRMAGDADRAADIQYAARDRELVEDWNAGRVLPALGLLALRVTIGYGIGDRMFRVLYWVLGLTILGAVVLWFSPEARAKGMLWRFGASLDHLLPIVELNKEFGAFFDDPQRRRLSEVQAVYFGCHALVGYVLASFVVTGLAGLTQAP